MTSSSESLTLLSLFFLGLAGSGHCVGMCGPIVAACAGRSGAYGQIAYHLGRLSTYAVVGAMVGGLADGLALFVGGGSFVWSTRIHKLSSALGAFVLAWMGLIKLGLLAEPKWFMLIHPARIPGFQRLQRRLDARHKATNGAGAVVLAPLAPLFALGLLLGILPCGLSYAAFARALGAGGAARGAALTFAFGLGTLPSLLLVQWTASRLSASHRRVSELLGGMLMIGMAAVLLLGTRGVL